MQSFIQGSIKIGATRKRADKSGCSMYVCASMQTVTLPFIRRAEEMCRQVCADACVVTGDDRRAHG
jgi:predicted GTPase